MTTFRAAQVTSPRGQLALIDRTLTDPAPGTVRIAVQACGICHSDAIFVDGQWPGLQFPLTPGHEIAGRIDALGDGVQGWRVRTAADLQGFAARRSRRRWSLCPMTGLTPAGRPVGSLSLDEIEEELARSERRLAAFRDASRKSHAESAAEAAALREMGTRAKEITSRPKTWRGGLKRSDAAELEALRGEIRSRAEAMSRTVEAMKSTSAEARVLAERQQALAKAILQDPDVVSLSSFIGIDGTNMLPNSGRVQINLKPREQRTDDASAIIRRIQTKLGDVKGITLYMQPVQDLTVEDRISRTQYQYSMEDADGKELSDWAPKLVDKLTALPQLRDVASDQQDEGFRTHISVDRDAAMRLGVSMQAIQDTLYDAFGQRQISTIFGQANQYRVVLEADPQWQTDPDSLRLLRVPTSANPIQ